MLILQLLWAVVWTLLALVITAGSFFGAVWVLSRHGGWAALAVWLGGIVVGSLCWGLSGMWAGGPSRRLGG